MENYDEIIASLYAMSPSFQNAGTQAYHPGMQTMKDFDERMGHPHENYRIIHVAGTNGKGSVSSMLASALAGLGYKVGLYTSPHLVDFRERVKFLLPEGNAPASAQTPAQMGMQSLMGSIAAVGADPMVMSALLNSQSVTQAAASVVPETVSEEPAQCISKEMVLEFWAAYGDFIRERHPSFFEITTALAFYAFAREKVDFAVVEVGLGGRLDSTNIVNPILSVITSIGLDHCALLGNTLAEIAREKAGIIKEDIPSVVGFVDPEAENEILQIAMEKNSELVRAREWNDLYLEMTGFDFAKMDLPGECQQYNVRTVLSCLFELYQENVIKAGRTSAFYAGKFSVLDFISYVTPFLYHAGKRTALRGRWERLSERPLVYADIAHNPQGVKMTMHQLRSVCEQHQISWEHCAENGSPALYLVFGVVADKDLASIMEFLPKGAYYFWTNAEGQRALPAARLAAVLSAEGFEGEICPTVADAVAKAKEKSNDLDIIYVGGSSFVVAEALEKF